MDLIPRQTIENLVQRRDDTLREFYQSIDLIISARARVREVCPHGLSDAVGQFYTAESERERVRQKLDRGMWQHVLELLNIKSLMTSKQVQQMQRQLDEDPMVFSVENIHGTITHLAANSGEIFIQSVVELYQVRNFTFKTNQPNRFAQKLILDGAFYPNSNSLCYHKRNVVYDLDKVVHIISGQSPPDEHTEGLLVALKARMYCGSHAFAFETTYFKVKKYKKGTLHITIKDVAIVEQMNLILAAHYDQQAIGGKRQNEH